MWRWLALPLQRAIGGDGSETAAFGRPIDHRAVVRRAAFLLVGAVSLYLLASPLLEVFTLLGLVPFTPGGLGFVEAGLTGTLVLAGIDAGDAVAIALVYRLASFWLPIPAGLVAAVVHHRRHS